MRLLCVELHEAQATPPHMRFSWLTRMACIVRLTHDLCVRLLDSRSLSSLIQGTQCVSLWLAAKCHVYQHTTG